MTSDIENYSEKRTLQKIFKKIYIGHYPAIIYMAVFELISSSSAVKSKSKAFKGTKPSVSYGVHSHETETKSLFTNERKLYSFIISYNMFPHER